MYNMQYWPTERKSSVAGQYFCVHDVGSLAAVNTESDILWIATARRRHVQLTAAEQWLVEHSHARKSLTCALLVDMANAGLKRDRRLSATRNARDERTLPLWL